MKTALLLLALALSACGGGGDPPPCNPPQLETFGDSTQSRAFPAWRARYGLLVTDHAVSGTSTSSLPRTVVTPGAVAIINFGLNDSIAGASVSTTLEQYRANLRALAHPPNAEVVFETPNPSTDPTRNVAPYAQVMREVAAEQGLQLIDTYVCFQQQPDWQARIPDQVHPDAQGMDYVVNVCAAPVMDALACR